MHNEPVLIWERDDYRIVAVDAEGDDDEPCFVVEQRCEDALGGECWTVVCPHDTDSISAMQALCLEIASHRELVPKWVRNFVRENHQDLARVNPKGSA